MSQVLNSRTMKLVVNETLERRLDQLLDMSAELRKYESQKNDFLGEPDLSAYASLYVSADIEEECEAYGSSENCEHDIRKLREAMSNIEVLQ